MKPAWFAPKAYGYGAGLPTCWQGWTLLCGYLIAVLAVTPICFAVLPPGTAAVASGIACVALTVPFVLIVKARTEGGWRWRNGASDT